MVTTGSFAISITSQRLRRIGVPALELQATVGLNTLIETSAMLIDHNDFDTTSTRSESAETGPIRSESDSFTYLLEMQESRVFEPGR
jgi:hypothetical protein